MTRMATRPGRRIKFSNLWQIVWYRTVRTGVALFLMLLFTGLFYAAASSALFEMQQVTVVGNHFLSDSDIVSHVELMDRNIFVIDKDQLARELNQSPWIRHSNISIRPPHRLQISITEVDPVLLYRAETEWQVYGDRGEVLPWRSFKQPLALPALTLQNDVTLERACQVMSHIRCSYPRLYSILQEATLGEQVSFSVGEGEVEAVLCWQHIDHQLTKLELFLDRPEMTNGNISHIDLRFQNKLITRRRTDT